MLVGMKDRMVLALMKRLISSRLGWVLLSIQMILILYWFGHAQVGSSGDLTAEAVYTGRFIAGRFVELQSLLSGMLVRLNVLPLLIGQGLMRVLLLRCHLPV